MTKLTDVNRSEVYRYMGLGTEMPDDKLREITESIITELAEKCNPSHCVRDTLISINGMTNTLDFCTVQSMALSKHLADCKSGYVLAATLGSEADRIISKYSVLSSVKAVAAQAAAAAMIEQYADDICTILGNESGMYLTPRFSPGYGDFSLDYQKIMLDFLDAGKKIGLCLTDGGLMTPVKSITAIIGKTENEQCNEKKCNGCTNTRCIFRK